EHTLAREPGDLLRHIAHDVERIRDDDDDRVRRRLLDLFGDLLDDAGVGVEQVVTRHAGLARDPGGDDDQVGAGALAVTIRTDNARIESFDRRGLPLVEAFTLRNAFDDIHQHYGARELLLRNTLRRRGPDVPRTDDRDFVDHE